MLSVFAAFEHDILRERVRAGLDHARQSGTRLGRPATAAIKAAEMRKLFGQGISKSEISRRLNIGRTSGRRISAQKKSLIAALYARPPKTHDDSAVPADGVAMGTMHRAKGLEFKAVLVMGAMRRFCR